jgi:hypothetical protein
MIQEICFFPEGKGCPAPRQDGMTELFHRDLGNDNDDQPLNPAIATTI